MEFIECKAEEETKAWALIEAGYDGAFNVNGEAYDSVFFQNANHSVRVTDDFMQAVVEDRELDDPLGHRPASPARPTRPASCMKHDGRGRLAVRRSRRAVRHHDQPLAHLPEHRPHQRLAIRASEYMFLDDTA